MQNKGTLTLALAAIIYGLFGILQRYIGLDFGVFYQNFIRNTIEVLVLLPLFLFKRPLIIPKRNDVKWYLARSIADLFTMVPVFVALNKIAIGTVYFLFYAGSLVGGFGIGFLIFKEKFTSRSLSSLLLAFCGLGMIFSFSGSGSFFYLMFAVFAGFCSSIWNTFSKKISDKYSSWQIVFWDCFLIAIMSIPFVFLFGESLHFPTASVPWLATILLALSSIVTSSLIVYGFRSSKAQYGTLILLLEAVFAQIFAFLFFHETIGIIAYAGGLLIMAAVVSFRLAETKQRAVRPR